LKSSIPLLHDRSLTGLEKHLSNISVWIDESDGPSMLIHVPPVENEAAFLENRALGRNEVADFENNDAVRLRRCGFFRAAHGKIAGIRAKLDPLAAIAERQWNAEQSLIELNGTFDVLGNYITAADSRHAKFSLLCIALGPPEPAFDFILAST
jgi:hypothetical protein